ncbi:MAG: tryptophan 2,3-dioxygenase [Bacteroidia bacterium]|nr:tryptophan 2,3-dioxygenase [Bacteroidia bacterium]
MSKEDVYYSDYLGLDKILNAQELESDKVNKHAHDEMLFIIIHQAYELWFKQVIYELGSVMDIFSQKSINDNAPDMQIAVHRLKRIVKILELAVQQVGIIETMTPLDFLDFRDMLRPASGFQSIQFKILEASLGLKMDERHMKKYYLSQLKPEDAERIKSIEKNASFIELINDWLERIPFFEQDELWDEYNSSESATSDKHPFWNDYVNLYEKSLAVSEEDNLKRIKQVLFEKNEERRFSPQANRAILFIMLYRDYPLLQSPFQLINSLLDIDELLSTWRYRHVSMVQRMIGTRIGTGGSTGKDYLMGALMKHYIFKEISELTTFLIERHNLPKLPRKLQAQLGFEV